MTPKQPTPTVTVRQALEELLRMAKDLNKTGEPFLGDEYFEAIRVAEQALSAQDNLISAEEILELHIDEYNKLTGKHSPIPLLAKSYILNWMELFAAQFRDKDNLSTESKEEKTGSGLDLKKLENELDDAIAKDKKIDTRLIDLIIGTVDEYYSRESRGRFDDNGLVDVANIIQDEFYSILSKSSTKEAEPLFVTEGVKLISEERREQLEKHNWSLEHDKTHSHGELIKMAAILCTNGTDVKVTSNVGDEFVSGSHVWGLESKLSGDKNKVHRLKVAGALIAAELDKELAAQSHIEKQKEDSKVTNQGDGWLVTEYWNIHENSFRIDENSGTGIYWNSKRTQGFNGSDLDKLTIHSVKRLKDGVVFSVGDTIYCGNNERTDITGFHISQAGNNMLVDLFDRGDVGIDALIKYIPSKDIEERVKEEKWVERLKQNFWQFALYYYNLTPPERCTVHPPHGEGMIGLYELPIEEILEKWLDKYNVIKNLKIN